MVSPPRRRCNSARGMASMLPRCFTCERRARTSASMELYRGDRTSFDLRREGRFCVGARGSRLPQTEVVDRGLAGRLPHPLESKEGCRSSGFHSGKSASGSRSRRSQARKRAEALPDARFHRGQHGFRSARATFNSAENAPRAPAGRLTSVEVTRGGVDRPLTTVKASVPAAITADLAAKWRGAGRFGRLCSRSGAVEPHAGRPCFPPVAE